MVLTGGSIYIIGCGGIILIMVIPRIRRGAQRINGYRKSLLKKYRYKKFIKSTKIVKCQKDDCVICFDDYSENNKCSELYCGHKFHNSCIREWIIHRESCPFLQAHPSFQPWRTGQDGRPISQMHLRARTRGLL